MPYFIVKAHDNPGMAELRLQTRPVHRARLREHDHPLKVHIGGPLLSDDGEMFGTFLIIEADDAATVRRFIDADPYARAGLYESVEITAFNWGLGKPEDSNDG